MHPVFGVVGLLWGCAAPPELGLDGVLLGDLEGPNRTVHLNETDIALLTGVRLDDGAIEVLTQLLRERP